MDLNDLNADRTAEMAIRHPLTNEPLVDEDGTPWVIVLYGMDSEAFQQAQDDLFERRLQEKQEKRAQGEMRRDAVQVLARCTKDWHLRWGGEVLECTYDNALRLYSDPGFQWLRQQVDRYMADRANFLPPSSESSTSSPSTNSTSRSKKAGQRGERTSSK